MRLISRFSVGLTTFAIGVSAVWVATLFASDNKPHAHLYLPAVSSAVATMQFGRVNLAFTSNKPPDVAFELTNTSEKTVTFVEVESGSGGGIASGIVIEPGATIMFPVGSADLLPPNKTLRIVAVRYADGSFDGEEKTVQDLRHHLCTADSE